MSLAFSQLYHTPQCVSILVCGTSYSFWFIISVVMPFYSCPLGKHIGGISIKILHYLIWCHERKGLSDSAGLGVLTVYIAACVCGSLCSTSNGDKRCPLFLWGLFFWFPWRIQLINHTELCFEPIKMLKVFCDG